MNRQICIPDIGNCLMVVTSTPPKCDMCRPGNYVALDGTCQPVDSDHHWIIYAVVVVVLVGAGVAVWMMMSRRNNNRDMLNPML